MTRLLLIAVLALVTGCARPAPVDWSSVRDRAEETRTDCDRRIRMAGGSQA